MLTLDNSWLLKDNRDQQSTLEGSLNEMVNIWNAACVGLVVYSRSSNSGMYPDDPFMLTHINALCNKEFWGLCGISASCGSFQTMGTSLSIKSNVHPVVHLTEFW